MNVAALYGLCFAAAVVLVAVLATRLTKGAKRSRNDLNGSQRDGDGVATWIGVGSARNEDPPDR